MNDEELKTDLARLRKQVRRLEAEMAVLRNESKRFRHMGFGRDIKDIQLMALEEERDSCLQRIAAIQREMGESPRRRRRMVDWLFIPVALVLLGFQALQPRRGPSRKEYPRRTQLRAKSVP